MRRLLVLAIGLLMLIPGVGLAQALPDGPLIMGYSETWSEWPVATGSATRLAQTPTYVDVVAIGFAKPDLIYSRPLDLRRTGIQVPFEGRVLKDAVASLKARNPRTRVILSVGGSGYAQGWADYQPQELARLVTDLGLDGVDIDYEPADPGCRPFRREGQISIRCKTDETWVDLIRRTRAALPRPAILAVAGWSIGAYGENAFRDDRPGGAYTGSMQWLGRAPEAAEIDLVSIMAYAAGTSFDPKRAFAAYRALWHGPLLLGAMVPPDPGGGPTYTVPLLTELSAHVAQDPKGGMMLYTLQSAPPGSGTQVQPDGNLAARAICLAMGRQGCEAIVP